MVLDLVKLRVLLVERSDPERAVGQVSYLRGQFPFIGVRKPIVTELVKSLYPVPEDEHELMLDVASLWKEEEREFQYAAIAFLRKSQKLLTTDSLSSCKNFILSKSWWDTVDEIAVHVLGKILLKNPKSRGVLDEWIASPCMWLRRSAIITQLHWKDKVEEERLFAYCKACAHEEDFFIRKAIGWALRQYSRTNPAAVLAFAKEHKQILSSLSYREAVRNLEEEEQGALSLDGDVVAQ